MVLTMCCEQLNPLGFYQKKTFHDDKNSKTNLALKIETYKLDTHWNTTGKIEKAKEDTH